MELSIKDMRDLLCPQGTATNPTSTSCTPALTIVIADRGWVFVGMASRSGDSIHLKDASVIRVWGTTKGLGQLALEGPTKTTVLDPCGDVRLPVASVVAEMAVLCRAEKWK